MRRVLREAGWFALFLAIAVILTWPLARRLTTSAADLGDPLLNAWILDWVCHALTHAPLDLFNPPIYHTGLYPLAYSENLVGIALFLIPLHLAGASALTIYNIAVILGMAFTGYGAFVLARYVSGSTIGALCGGIFFGFGSFIFSHLAHVQILWSGWLPLLLAAILLYWRQPTRRHAALVGAAFLMNGLTNIHWLLFGGFALAATILFLHVHTPQRDRRFWLQLFGALLLAGLVLLPLLIPYQLVAGEYGARRTTAEGRNGSASWTDWLISWTHNRVYGPVPDPELRRAERQLFPGLAILGLVLIGALRASGPPVVAGSTRDSKNTRTLDILIALALIATWFMLIVGGIEVGRFRSSGADVPAMLACAFILVRLHRTYPDFFARSRFTREEWAAALWVIIGVVASFGWNSFLHPFLFRVFSPFRATRTPARWAIIAGVGLAVWAAIGVATILKRSQKRQLVASLLLALVVVEVLPDVRWEQVPVQPAPVYQWLKRERPGVVLELPMTGGGAQFRYLLANAYHRVPLINGTSGWETPLHEKLRQHEENDAFTTAIEQGGGAIIIIHADHLGEREAHVKRWLREQLASGRLLFLRRFDHDVHGDYVFAVTKNLRDAGRLRAPESPDGAGQLPSQNLARFLDGQPTYSDAITLVVETPGFEDINGPLQVKGWTLSPHIVRRVTILLDEGSQRYDVPLAPRPDVVARFPWYRHATPNPGFTLAFPHRPRGVPQHTDVQVEVLDNAGRIARSTHVLIEWR